MSDDPHVHIELALSPEGHVYLCESSLTNEPLSFDLYEKLKTLFIKGSSQGLLHLGIQEFPSALPSSFLFWQSFSRQFVTKVCKFTHSENQDLPLIPPPDTAVLQDVIIQTPFINGIEYLNSDLLIKSGKALLIA